MAGKRRQVKQKILFGCFPLEGADDIRWEVVPQGELSGEIQ
jgi:hypothetical protein